MAFEAKIAEHERRRARALQMGGPKKLAQLAEKNS